MQIIRLKFLSYILLFLVSFQGIAQTFAPKKFYLIDSLVIENLTESDQTLLDSCLTVYHASRQDSDKIIALNDVCDYLVSDVWIDYQFIQYHLVLNALKKKPTDNEKLFLKNSLSVSLNNIGLYYERHKGNSSKALKYYLNSLNLNDELDNQQGVAILLNRVGQIYIDQGDAKKGVEYFQKSLTLFKKLGNEKEISNPLNNMGLYVESIGEHRKALEYFNKSLIIDRKVGNQQGVAMSLSNIGRVYVSLNNYSKALISFIQGLDIFEKMGDKNGISLIKTNIGQVYLIQGDANSAYVNAKESFDIAQKIGFPIRISNSALLLSSVYEMQHKNKEALTMFKLYTLMKDSMANENTREDAIRQQSKYEYEKQKAVDDAIHGKQIAIEEKSREKQQIIIYAIAGGLTLLAIFLAFVFNRLQITRKQKTLIESQKKVVESAHKELSEKNKEILDSINYAKRIQTAILPSDKLMKESLTNSFVLYKPKDIVAGDFYWMEAVPSSSRHAELDSASHKNKKTANQNEIVGQDSNDVVLFAACDCTGHGVPGAMVSVVCNNALNRSVREHGLTEPGLILDKTREIVIQEFEKSDENVKDGMDIALCSIAFPKLSESSELSESYCTLQYAGANNPLWIIRPKSHSTLEEFIRSKVEVESPKKENTAKLNKIAGQDSNDEFELYETKANKQPIGSSRSIVPFTTHTLHLHKGDTVYIFSDGLVDQFGGENFPTGRQGGKKFKAKSFRELLLSIQDKTMEEQKNIIDKTFENWKGNLEQIDDVCIIGVRI